MASLGFRYNIRYFSPEEGITNIFRRTQVSIPLVEGLRMIISTHWRWGKDFLIKSYNYWYYFLSNFELLFICINHSFEDLQNKKHSKKHVHRRFFSFTGKLIFVKRCEGQLFRDTEAGRSCPRGIHCTYAHSQSELRQSIHRRFRGNSRFTDLKNMQYLKPNFSYGSSLAISKSTVPVLPISIDSGAVVGSNQRVGKFLFFPSDNF